MNEFDIFFDEYENKHNCSPEKYECFEAGTQSRQAEIDELQKRIDKALSAVWNGKCSHTIIDILKGTSQD